MDNKWRKLAIIMSNELQLVKTDKFGEVEYNIYSNEEEMYMTSEQLGECLGYSNGKKGVDNIIARNEYLNNPEFSVAFKLRATDGKYYNKHYNTRLFTEDGIYEVTILAQTDIAKEFRAHIKTVLKGIRKEKIISANTDKSIEIQERDSLIRLSEQFLKISNVDTLSKEYKNILVAKAAEVLAGTPILPLPKSE